MRAREKRSTAIMPAIPWNEIEAGSWLFHVGQGCLREMRECDTVEMPAPSAAENVVEHSASAWELQIGVWGLYGGHRARRWGSGYRLACKGVLLSSRGVMEEGWMK